MPIDAHSPWWLHSTRAKAGAGRAILDVWTPPDGHDRVW
jgi:hypothetical protein